MAIKVENPGIEISNILFGSNNIFDKENQFYQIGERDGGDLVSIIDGLKMIEAYFNYLIQSSAQAKQFLNEEAIKAQVKRDIILENIEQLKIDADENIKGSKAFALRKNINALKAKKDRHQQIQYQDAYVHDINNIIKDWTEKEKIFAKGLSNDAEEARNEIRKLVRTINEKLIEGTESILDPLIEDPDAEQIINQFSNRSKKIIKLWRDTRKNIFNKVTKSHEKAMNRFRHIVEDIKRARMLAVPSRLRIINNMIIFSIVLLGEIFLIYGFTTETLGMDPTYLASRLGVDKDFLIKTIFIFCIAYPLALGMLAKKIIRRNIRKVVETMTKSLVVVVLLLILSISILNALTIESIGPNEDLSLEEPTSFLGNLKLVLYTIAFFGITTLFSIIAGSIYEEIISGYELYRNARKHNIFQRSSKSNYLKDCNQEIENNEKSIEKIKDKLEKKQEELVRLQGEASRDFTAWELGSALEELREASMNAYRRGYQRGLNNLLEKYQDEPERLLDRLYNRKIAASYIQLINQNTLK